MTPYPSPPNTHTFTAGSLVLLYKSPKIKLIPFLSQGRPGILAFVGGAMLLSPAPLGPVGLLHVDSGSQRASQVEVVSLSPLGCHYLGLGLSLIRVQSEKTWGMLIC